MLRALWRGDRKSDNSWNLQTGQFAVESSLLLRVAIYEYNIFSKLIELSYALLTAKHPVTIVLQTLVHASLPLAQSPALLTDRAGL